MFDRPRHPVACLQQVDVKDPQGPPRTPRASRAADVEDIHDFGVLIGQLKISGKRW